MRILLLAFCLGLSACAPSATLSLGAAEPRWAQRAEEAGRLPVGRVMAVDVVGAAPAAPLLKPGTVGTNGVVPDSVDTAALLREASRKATTTYRHQLRLRDGTLREVEVEYRFEPGECVALRGPSRAPGSAVQIVSALSGACDA